MPLNRRTFCCNSAALLVATGRLPSLAAGLAPSVTLNVDILERARVMKLANGCLDAAPVTITASHSPRSPGGPHDFYSEGDYWWPDPKNPGGPYIRRDGLTNPENFIGHREAILRFSLIVPALAAAWKLTRQRKYAEHAAAHLRAWFITPETRMNPNLEHAQAIFGVNQGRGTGIIDTIHLVEPVRAAGLLLDAGVFTPAEQAQLHGWFADYLTWLTTSKNGIEERDAKNNHGSCWTMQAAAFASFTGNQAVLAYCRDNFRTKLVPDQVAPNGSLPLELARTKPYSYALFDMDILATTAQILSTPAENLYAFTLPDGRGLRSVIAYMAPFIRDKKSWPLPPDVEWFDDLPVRQPSLLFAGLAYGDASYLALWKMLNPDPMVPEIIRNFPIRQPVLWV
jgi:hypothetical protein